MNSPVLVVDAQGVPDIVAFFRVQQVVELKCKESSSVRLRLELDRYRKEDAYLFGKFEDKIAIVLIQTWFGHH